MIITINENTLEISASDAFKIQITDENQDIYDLSDLSDGQINLLILIH